MRVKERFLELLFPRKCVLCRKMLSAQETDICTRCRSEAPEFRKAKNSIPFVAGWTAVWYYRDNVRRSILRYKFQNARAYAAPFGRVVAMRIQEDMPEDIDILTWVPVSPKRLRKRGYDQCALLAKCVGAELGMEPTSCLRKIRNAGPQSRLANAAQRKANILGAYTVISSQVVKGKKILILDDVVTTGSTVSECARMLMTAGAEKVYCAAIAATDKNKRR